MSDTTFILNSITALSNNVNASTFILFALIFIWAIELDLNYLKKLALMNSRKKSEEKKKLL